MADISAEDLIPLIEQRRVIWDKNSDIYKDKALKATAWREICCVVNPDFHKLGENERKHFAKSVTIKWAHIRDAFLRSQKAQKKKILRPGVIKKPRPYVYKNLLKFLMKADDHMNNHDPGNESQSSSSNNSCDREAAPEQQYQPPPAKIMVKIEEDFTLEEKLTMFLDSNLNYQQENSHISFMKGILPSLSTFDDDENLEFQMGVLALIQKIKRKRL